MKLIQGDCREVLRGMAAGSVRCCVTSPPYFGLRDYGVEGQIGLEQTPEEYVARLVEVFRGVRRVLADDGTLWLNLGDSYSRAPEKGGSGPGGKNESRWGYGAAPSAKVGSSDGGVGRAERPGTRAAISGLKPKDLIGIPWRVAFALQADGWYLRQDIIWHKPNPMPESVRDRCTKAHEYMFLLSKQERYYFDAEAISEPADPKNHRDSPGVRRTAPGSTDHTGFSDGRHFVTRNRRSVWSVIPASFKGAHFATFPPALVEPCIRAGSAVGDIVLDPFNGAGTTGLVALREGRHYVGIDLNPDYLHISAERLAKVAGIADLL